MECVHSSSDDEPKKRQKGKGVATNLSSDDSDSDELVISKQGKAGKAAAVSRSPTPPPTVNADAIARDQLAMRARLARSSTSRYVPRPSTETWKMDDDDLDLGTLDPALAAVRQQMIQSNSDGLNRRTGGQGSGQWLGNPITLHVNMVFDPRKIGSCHPMEREVYEESYDLTMGTVSLSVFLFWGGGNEEVRNN